MTTSVLDQEDTAVTVPHDYLGKRDWNERIREWNGLRDANLACGFVHGVFDYAELGSRRPVDFLLALINDRMAHDDKVFNEGWQAVTDKALQVFVHEFLDNEYTSTSGPRWLYVFNNFPGVIASVFALMSAQTMLGTGQKSLLRHVPFRKCVHKFLLAVFEARDNRAMAFADAYEGIRTNRVGLMRLMIEYGLAEMLVNVRGESDLAALKDVALGTGEREPTTLAFALKIPDTSALSYRRRAAEIYVAHAVRAAATAGTTMDLDKL